MVRRIRRSTLFSLIAVVALLSLGIGYAAWTETLELDGHVTTANFDVQWGSPSAAEVDDHGNGTCVPTRTNNNNRLLVTIDNAYPGYSCTVTVNIANPGEVNAELESTTRFEGNSQTGNGGQDDPYPNQFNYTPFACAASVVPAGGAVSCQFGIEATDNVQEGGAVYQMSIEGDFQVEGYGTNPPD
ncbi:MAG: hypothetical protein R3A46_19735 [Thermomicrobiales bacterium]